MIRISILLQVFIGFLVVVALSPAGAETYTWTDAQSIVHFTDDPHRAPKEYQNKLRKLDDDGSAQAEPPGDAVDKEMSGRALPEEGSANMELYAGKSYEQWAKEFAGREAEMIAVRKQIDENAVRLQAGPVRQMKEKLLTEREELLTKFREMKSEYVRQVDIARAAGIKITIEERQDNVRMPVQ